MSGLEIRTCFSSEYFFLTFVRIFLYKHSRRNKIVKLKKKKHAKQNYQKYQSKQTEIY